MARETERSAEDLYRDDPARADAVTSSRRGFLGGAGLAAMGAAIGGAMPFSNTLGGLIPAANAQGARGPRPCRRRARNS